MLPLSKIIRIFHEKLQHCDNCRNCSVMTLDSIETKLLKLKPKLSEGGIVAKDGYFGSDEYTKCSIGPMACRPNLAFEQYIEALYNAP
jgi:hypothetical protein